MSRPGTIDFAALEDGELVALAVAGRQAAFATLMTRHKQPLYRLIAAQVRDAEEALDLLQETFVAAYGALARFDRERSMRAWLARIALNKCRDWARRRRVRAFLGRLLPIDAVNAVADDAVGAEASAIDRDSLRRTLDAVARLPAALREPLLLCAVDEMSQSEAAQALGISVKAVETRLRRARIALGLDRSA